MSMCQDHEQLALSVYTMVSNDSKEIAKVGRKHTAWHPLNIKKVQSEVKAAVLKFGLEDNRRLRFLLSNCLTHSENGERSGPERFVFALASLAYHLRYGGLSEKQIDSLSELAFRILRLNKVPDTGSINSYLYADVHTLLAHIARKNGSHWRSAWEMQSSLRSTHYTTSEQSLIGGLSTAIRNLRLGMCDFVLEELGDPKFRQLDDTHYGLCHVIRARAFRLAGRIDELRKFAHESLSDSRIVSEAKLDLKWELLVTDGMLHGDSSIFERVGMPKSDFRGNPSFLIEAAAWLLLHDEVKWVRDGEPLKLLQLSGRSPPVADRRFAKCLRVLISCYDSEIPMGLRLQNLGVALEETRLMHTIDRELLLWAGAKRWLIRARNSDLERIVSWEYYQLSLRCTEGRSRDVLRAFGSSM